jgi:hypothetical protein
MMLPSPIYLNAALVIYLREEVEDEIRAVLRDRRLGGASQTDVTGHRVPWLLILSVQAATRGGTA